jgi:hypothetical protein
MKQHISTWKLILVCNFLVICLGILFCFIPTYIALAFRYNYSYIPILLAVLYITCTYFPERLGNVLLLNLVLWACLLPLSGLWRSGLSESFIVGGLLPFSDAGGYYLGAVKFLNCGSLDYFSSRRPLFPGMLASLLGLTQGDLRFSLIIIVALTAICIYLVVREMHRDYGYGAGLFMFLLLFLFYRRFIGATVTENLGLALGCLGFVALWRSAVHSSLGYGFLGLFVLAMALCARAGAFFVLPAIVMWGMWVFRGEQRFSKIFLFGGVASVAAAFALDVLLRRVITPVGFIGFSNFSYIVYGLLAGGNWQLIYTQHPEICHLLEPELSQRVNAIAFEMLRQHPLWLLYGILRAWKLAFWFPKPEQSIYGFFIIMDSAIYPRQSTYHFLLSYILPAVNILALIALLSSLKKKCGPRNLLMLAVAVGIFFSLPFARLEDADNMRAYAATIPFLALFPVAGTHWLMGKIVRGRSIAKASSKASWLPLTVLASMLITLSALAPMGIRAFTKSQAVFTQPLLQRVGENPIWFSPGASVSLTADSHSHFFSRYNVVNIRDFRENLGLFRKQYPGLAEDLQSLSPSTTITLTRGTGSEPPYLFLIFDNSRVKIPAGPAVVYGEVGVKKLAYYWRIAICLHRAARTRGGRSWGRQARSMATRLAVPSASSSSPVSG